MPIRTITGEVLSKREFKLKQMTEKQRKRFFKREEQIKKKKSQQEIRDELVLEQMRQSGII